MRQRWRLLFIPTWVSWPLMWLGFFFVAAKPLGWEDWYFYGISLVMAALFGVVGWRVGFRPNILERSEGGTTVLYTRRIH